MTAVHKTEMYCLALIVFSHTYTKIKATFKFNEDGLANRKCSL